MVDRLGIEPSCIPLCKRGKHPKHFHGPSYKTCGSRGGSRTHNLTVNSRVLCQIELPWNNWNLRQETARSLFELTHVSIKNPAGWQGVCASELISTYCVLITLPPIFHFTTEPPCACVPWTAGLPAAVGTAKRNVGTVCIESKTSL